MLGFGGGGGGGSKGGRGSPPIATNVGLPAYAAFPATARRTETAVRTTSTASNKVRIRFFIEALLDKTPVPIVRPPA